MPIKDSIESIGKGYEKVGDDRGHLIGDQFGGANSLENMIPQKAEINQTIYEKLTSIIQEDWEKLIYRADYDHDSWSMIFYLLQKNGIIKDCYSMEEISRGELIELFSELNTELKECRDIEGWYVMTMTILQDGTFKTDFVYDDISRNLADYYKA